MEHPLLGDVELRPRAAARRFIARVRAGRVVLTVPPRATAGDIGRALDAMAPRLLPVLEAAPPLYADGMAIERTGMRVVLRVDDSLDGVRLRGTTADATLLVGAGLSLADPDVMRAVTTMLMRLAALRAPSVLLPYATAVAVETGARPRRFKLSRGMRTLGRCNEQGEIALSAALMFLPDHLRRYVVCHELAHLRHFDHSPAFHALCDRYCGGREAALVAELKAFRWPLLR